MRYHLKIEYQELKFRNGASEGIFIIRINWPDENNHIPKALQNKISSLLGELQRNTFLIIQKKQRKNKLSFLS